MTNAGDSPSLWWPECPLLRCNVDPGLDSGYLRCSHSRLRQEWCEPKPPLLQDTNTSVWSNTLIWHLTLKHFIICVGCNICFYVWSFQRSKLLVDFFLNTGYQRKWRRRIYKYLLSFINQKKKVLSHQSWLECLQSRNGWPVLCLWNPNQNLDWKEPSSIMTQTQSKHTVDHITGFHSHNTPYKHNFWCDSKQLAQNHLNLNRSDPLTGSHKGHLFVSSIHQSLQS